MGCSNGIETGIIRMSGNCMRHLSISFFKHYRLHSPKALSCFTKQIMNVLVLVIYLQLFNKGPKGRELATLLFQNSELFIDIYGLHQL